MLQAESFESVTIEEWAPMPEAVPPPQPALYGIKKMVRVRAFCQTLHRLVCSLNSRTTF
jgi:hypothetical protein